MMQNMMGGGMPSMPGMGGGMPGGGNNLLNTMIQMKQRGENPITMLRQMEGQDPRISNLLKLIDGKTPQQFWNTADNIAKQQGGSVQQVVEYVTKNQFR